MSLRRRPELRLFNSHYDEYGFQPIVGYNQEGRFVTALLRPAKRPKGVEIRAFLRRLVRAIRLARRLGKGVGPTSIKTACSRS